MCVCVYLHVGRGVPVRVVDHHAVGASQVDPDPAHTRGQQEHKNGGILYKTVKYNHNN